MAEEAALLDGPKEGQEDDDISNSSDEEFLDEEPSQLATFGGQFSGWLNFKTVELKQFRACLTYAFPFFPLCLRL